MVSGASSDLVKYLRTVKRSPISLEDARALWLKFRLAKGYKGYADLLTSPEANTKLLKSAKDAAIYGLSLAPSDLSKFNPCRYSTPECRAGCVAYAGKGELPNIAQARITKTEFLAKHPDAFLTILSDEIGKAKKKHGKKLAVRLNTFSDIPWEDFAPELFRTHKSVQFYDYTKWPSRVGLSNYHLTYSASEKTRDSSIPARLERSSVAVVFSTKRGHPLPETFAGARVIDGDESDARFKDPKGIVVGLRAKGRMRKGDWKMVRTVCNTST